MSRIDYGQVPACTDGEDVGEPFVTHRRVSDIELDRGANWDCLKWIPTQMTNMQRRFCDGAKALVGYNPRTDRWKVLQIREPRRQ